MKCAFCGDTPPRETCIEEGDRVFCGAKCRFSEEIIAHHQGRAEALEETLGFVVHKVHETHHEGTLRDCAEETCSHAVKILGLDQGPPMDELSETIPEPSVGLDPSVGPDFTVGVRGRVLERDEDGVIMKVDLQSFDFVQKKE